MSTDRLTCRPGLLAALAYPTQDRGEYQCLRHIFLNLAELAKSNTDRSATS